MEIFNNAILRDYTTFKIGGTCKKLVIIENIKDLESILNETDDLFILGNGSNILASDDGYDGTVIKLGGTFNKIGPYNETFFEECGAATPLKKLCIEAKNQGFSGLEWAYGIPATVGGAIYMNAGAYGGEMSQVVSKVTVYDTKTKRLTWLTGSELDFSYRHSIFHNKKYIILAANIILTEKKDPLEIEAKMQEFLNARKAKQPLEYPSAGSFFKRPADGVYAAKLIEDCGLKGLTVGGAQVSEKHSGFIVNIGNATFNDVITLGEKVNTIVKGKTGFLLEFEPEILR